MCHPFASHPYIDVQNNKNWNQNVVLLYSCVVCVYVFRWTVQQTQKELCSADQTSPWQGVTVIHLSEFPEIQSTEGAVSAVFFQLLLGLHFPP
jgi:hypothetical protein